MKKVLFVLILFCAIGSITSQRRAYGAYGQRFGQTSERSDPELLAPLIPSESSETVRPQIQRSETEQCGVRPTKHQQLITSGSTTIAGDWPWHSAIFHTRRHQQSYKCGGTLINSNTVVTAAHCLYDDERPIIAERVLVHLGKHNIELSGPNTQEFRAHRLIIHESYSTATLLDDIALIRLSGEATFTGYVQPICLWEAGRSALTEVIGRNGVAVGWGLNELDSLSNVLGQVLMPVVSVLTCLRSDPSFYAPFLTENTYCAGFRNGSSTCNGDSGGGMYFEENGIYRLRGIVSLSKSRSSQDSFCDTKKYILFTDVCGYLDWIRDNSK